MTINTQFAIIEELCNYMDDIVRKQVISFKIPQVKHRVHYALFAEDTPFKPKVVKRRDTYKRKPKYVNRDSDWE